MISRATLLEDVRRLFAPANDPSVRQSMSLGAELEMIPAAANGERILARGPAPSGSDLTALLAREYGWMKESMEGDPACYVHADGRITFEPGGQIEFSSAVFPSAETLIDSLDTWLPRIHSAANQLGIILKTVGIEDRIPIERVPLQLSRDRYTAMTKYFETVGPFGVLMMRQTASLQINVDRGGSPLARWRLLNALVPYLVAIFANSSRYEGRETGHRSFRAHVWRKLDPRRTGIIYREGREAEHYLEFALNAPVILGGNGTDFRTFREQMGSATIQDWEIHLSTLFPEIRPRDYFEIRSTDAIEARHVGVAVIFVAGLVYDASSAVRATKLLGEATPDLLVRAGTLGLRDPAIRSKSVALTQLALEGCERLGYQYVSAQKVEAATRFFAEFTLKGRSPADA